MIEINMTYDLLPGADQKAYQEWIKRASGAVLSDPSLIEMRANRNILGSPEVRITTVWKTLSDWAAFSEGEVWKGLKQQMDPFVTHRKVEIWGPSLVMPEPLRPEK